MVVKGFYLRRNIMHRILDFLNLKLWTSIWRVLVVGRKHETSMQRNGGFEASLARTMDLDESIRRLNENSEEQRMESFSLGELKHSFGDCWRIN